MPISRRRSRRCNEEEAKIRQFEDQLMAARDEHKDTRYALWNEVKRARAGAKAKHGDDSGEYERFGGTRISERHRRIPALTLEAPLLRTSTQATRGAGEQPAE